MTVLTRLIRGEMGKRGLARTRMVEISWRMSTACCAATCLSFSGIVGVLRLRLKSESRD